MRIRSFFRRNGRDLLIDGAIVFGVLSLIMGGLLLLWVSTLEIPDLASFESRRVLQSTKIYDRTGEILLYDLHQDVRRTVVPFEDISRHIKNATVAIEDDTFYEHHGVRPLRILKAVFDNVLSGDPLGGQGGSTITQQVIKNSILVQEKTLTRKVKEWILAIKLEQRLTKEEILWHYLNESPYGGTMYGVEEASLAFFGKRAADVTLTEAAYLASLPQAPTYYSPYSPYPENRAALEARKNQTLEQMLKNGFITQEEYDQARNDVIEFRPQERFGIRAPHFVFYVREYLARKYGEESLAERGFKVITTIDYELQEQAEQIVEKHALRNEETFNAENAALVAMDPQTGQILTMVGSRNYFDDTIDGNFNVAVAERQPGSSFKPFVYAQAFMKGYTPETILFDLPTQFSTTCSPDNLTSEDGCYAPRNYDGQFRGPISIRNALAQSLNIPAVKTLYLAGITDSIKLARDMGITTLTNANQYGLTLVLGGGEVKLLDMVNAYGTFAAEGVRHDVTSILRIEDNRGNVIEEFEDRSDRVMDTQVALQISDILSDNVARTPLYGPNSQLHFPGRDVAAKTGTTNDSKDVWIVGYTPKLAVGAWAGNNIPAPMNQISGLIITPLWREYMDVALEKLDADSEFFEEPAATPTDLKPILRGIWFDPFSFSSDDEGVPEFSLEGALSGAHSILYYVDKDNPRGPYPSNPARDPQFPLWEYAVSAWKSAMMAQGDVVIPGMPTPTEEGEGEENNEDEEEDNEEN